MSSKKTTRKRVPAGSAPGTSMEEPSILLQAASLAAMALRIAAKAGGASVKVGRALIESRARDTKTMRETGAYLKDLRELAGLTRAELARAVNLSDQSLLAAAEQGTATLSFELILRLAALLARHDPIPFVMKITRTYDPEIWDILEKWGVGRVAVQFERERKFINILREHDNARKLTDGEYEKVLKFTRAAFEMALYFIAGEEEDKVVKGREKPRAKKRSGRRTGEKPA